MIYFLLGVLAIGAVIYEHALILGFIFALWYGFIHSGVISWIISHPLQTALYVAGYFVVGAVWSVIKWWFSETAKFRDAKDEWEALTEAKRAKEVWADFIAIRKTKVRIYTEDIAVWVGLWPFNALYTLLDDPIRRLVNRIVAELRGVYQRITDHVWR